MKQDGYSMKIFFIYIAVAFMSGLISCQNNKIMSDSSKVNTVGEKAAQIMNADNAFGFELFRQIRDVSNENNLLISPLSVSVALSIAYNGADSDTRKEMENTLKLNGLSIDQINAAYRNLIAGLQSKDPKITFEIANALFYTHGFKIKPDFLAVSEKVYDAEISSLDFNDPDAVKAINKWVDKKTHGKITDIISQLNPLDRMILLNAVYFYGTWSKEFDEHGTQIKPFTKNDGTKIEVPMMSKTDTIPYLAQKEFKAVELPYGEGSYKMVVILPEEGYNSEDLISSLSIDKWQSWQEQFKLTERVQITMPRFKFAFETSLKDVLSALGMGKAFTPKVADFSRIADVDLHLSEVKHKTYIDVNETGTEAAEVTGAVFSTTSLIEQPPVVPFVVDKPFLFAIAENESGAILFIGEVNHPEYK